jgi:SAM-dependent methyltransferase
MCDGRDAAFPSLRTPRVPVIEHAEVRTMSERSRFNPTDRFTGLAEIYARCRPSYPPRAIDYVVDRSGLKEQSVLVDVGCGTGISSRLFAARGMTVIGIEPNAEMRTTAAASETEAADPRVTYLEGRAESTGLPVGIADAVMAAQAFHWFEPESSLRESHRILKSSGWVILLWNERDEQDPFTAAFGDVIRTAPSAAAVEIPRSQAGSELASCPLFREYERVTFGNEQTLDEEGLLGRAFSASYAPREAGAAATWAERLGAVFDQYQREGQVVIRYLTTIHMARRD